jgi:hypothetical protein
LFCIDVFPVVSSIASHLLFDDEIIPGNTNGFRIAYEIFFAFEIFSLLHFDRYGNGQYRFKVNVRDQNGVLKYFVIETAMLAEMPHAIDHFFRMIEKKLWDGLALIHEPYSQIISATPIMTDESHAWAGQRFVDANLTHMAFTEHTPTYPPPHHRKFTVAFSGRPGGPGFYISLDNELEYAHEHESTFGVVMEGRDVLYQLFLTKDKGIKRVLEIESINILPTKKPREEKS